MTDTVCPVVDPPALECTCGDEDTHVTFQDEDGEVHDVCTGCYTQLQLDLAHKSCAKCEPGDDW